MTTRTRTLAFALAAALPLAGCLSFGAKPPPTLLTLTASAAPAVGQDATTAAARSIVIDVPATPQAIATTRVPVQVTPTTIAYVAKAQWAEPPARLFARLLGDTVAARTGRVVLSTVQSATDPGARLTGELRFVGFDAAAHQAVVVFDAALTRGGTPVPAPAQRVDATQVAAAVVGVTPGAIDKRRFEARVPVASIDADAAPAINDAANQVATQVADWVGR